MTPDQQQARIAQLEKAIDDILRNKILAHETSGHYYRVGWFEMAALERVRREP